MISPVSVRAVSYTHLDVYKRQLYRIKLEADYLKKLALEGAHKRYGEVLSEEVQEDVYKRQLFGLGETWEPCRQSINRCNSNFSWYFLSFL